ncbi:MAG TPA: radical SAM protein, partial [Anaerolineae bacterium]|nr:radical SAM protein [Anaerolineae bacterium]
MIIQGRWSGTVYAISLKDSSLSVAINGDHILVCDLAGRLYSIYHAGRHQRRSLSGQILQKWTVNERQRRWLTEAEADRLLADTAGHFRQLQAALCAPDWEWITPPDRSAALDDLLPIIDRAAHFDSGQARADAARFAEVYSPIGILPPDQYLALVLQATTGCSFNTCTFCDLYHQPFRVKTPDEFRRHLRAVREYLGTSILLRQRSIFLGAANALAVPLPRLLPIFDIISEELAPSPDAQGRDGVGGKVYAFLDAFTGTYKSVEEYRALAERGLRRVYIGLESGHDPLLEFVRKPGRAHDAIETVQTIKAAGINVGVIVLIGLGGARFATAHTADTSDVLNQLHLGTGDLLYFSDLVEEPGTPYP